MSMRFPSKSLLLVTVSVLGACQPAMRHQDKPHSQGYSVFFPDHRDARPPVAGTVGYLQEDIRAGVIAQEPAESSSESPITAKQLERGQGRYAAFCSPCHGRTGIGDGMVVQHGFPRPPSLLEERLRHAPDAFLFGVITDGAGAMPEYSTQIAVADRWAIVAYLRALQLSQTETKL